MGFRSPVIVARKDNKDYIRVLLYSYYATITGWGVLLIQDCQRRVAINVLDRARLNYCEHLWPHAYEL